MRVRDGWLALAGLFWLDEGVSAFGSDPTCPLVLPADRAPAQLGTFELRDGRVTLRTLARGMITVNDEPVHHTLLEPDTSPSPSHIRYDDLTMVVIQRGLRVGIRLWDNRRMERHTCPSRTWFPVIDAFRIRAQFHPHVSPHLLSVPDVFGDISQHPSMGEVTFLFGSKEYHLETLEGGQDGLFLIFHDTTNGSSTYPGGRYLTTAMPERGEVWLDFNRAYNPPCAFTPFATCTLPPAENHLDLAIKAGERFIAHEASASSHTLDAGP